MEIKIENVKAAFNTADESGKKLLLALFPELSSETAQKADNRPVTERIKTFEDAMLELGEEHPFVKEWHLGENLSTELEAYLEPFYRVGSVSATKGNLRRLKRGLGAKVYRR